MTFPFQRHEAYEGGHAFLSASSPHWLNYDDEKLLATYERKMTAALGTRLHSLAAELILLGINLPNTSQTLNMYVNDCIGYRMQPEVMLWVNAFAYGTADAIDFDGHTQTLRIFDLKNGTIDGKERQLKIYAAYFCLEYHMRPTEIGFDLRFYQNDDVTEFHTDPEEILRFMDQTKHASKLLAERKGA